MTSIAALAAGIAAIFLNPVSTRLSMLTTCLILFYAWWLYFRANWHKKGQTLAMQTWKIGLADKNDTQPPLPQLRLRFIWASIFYCFHSPACLRRIASSAQYTAQRRIRSRAHLAHPAMGFRPVPSRPPVPLRLLGRNKAGGFKSEENKRIKFASISSSK